MVTKDDVMFYVIAALLVIGGLAYCLISGPNPQP